MNPVRPISESHPSMMRPEKRSKEEFIPKEKAKEKINSSDKNEKIIYEARNIAARHALEAHRQEQELLAELRKRMQKI